MKFSKELNCKVNRNKFIILAINGCIANLIGFISNVVLFGWSAPSIVVGICALLMFSFSAFGFKERNIPLATVLILFLIDFFEFPYLYTIYGYSTSAYLILGFTGIFIFLHGFKRYILAALICLLDIFIFFVYKDHPISSLIDPDSAFYAMVCTHLIVFSCLGSLLVLLLYQYDNQKLRLEKLTGEFIHMANIDPLTNLYNRRYLGLFISERTNSPKRIALVLLDIDDFKDINDNFGHVYGDEVLTILSNILMKKVKDIGIASRYGGEEFMLVIEEKNLADLELIIKEIKQEFQEYSMKTKQSLFTFSGGIEFFEPNDQMIRLFKAVDNKLYKAKRAGKDQLVS